MSARTAEESPQPRDETLPPQPLRPILRGVETSASTASERVQEIALGALIRDLHKRLMRIELMLRILPVLVAQVADPTHLSIEGAARVLGVSTKTIRRRIASGGLI